MIRLIRLNALLLVPSLFVVACQSQPTPRIGYDPAALRFSGLRALELETEFVTLFPNRDSGQPNNRRAAEWLLGRFTELGWTCAMDEWEIINYSRPVKLNNVVCHLPGGSGREVLVVAHHDQAPTTIQGADNDGSGIAILLQLAGIFSAETDRRHDLVFVATDGEEYGMLGSRRYVQTHDHPENILAGISLDNLGRDYYDGMNMELIGQFDNYGPIWLALTARQAARAADLDWDVYLRAPIDQITDQAAPVSFMDQGPMVAQGIPALGFAARVPPEFADLHHYLWHNPDDTLEHQSAEALGQSGLIAEALIRQLQTMESTSQESGPYLYFEGTNQVLRGAPLWAIFFGLVALFLAGSLGASRQRIRGTIAGWRAALPHFLGLWLPLLASILLLYAFVALGVMTNYHLYPATAKDPDWYHPRWPAVLLYLLGLGVCLYLGRALVRRFWSAAPLAEPRAIKSLALLVVALGGLYLMAVNPFSLLFCVPLLFWLLIGQRRAAGRGLDLLFFLLGGLVVYGLIYVFGFQTLRTNWAILWFLLQMFSIRMISFPTAAVITALLAAGLTLVVRPPSAGEARR